MEMKEVNGSVKSEDLDEIKTEIKNDSKKTRGEESLDLNTLRTYF